MSYLYLCRSYFGSWFVPPEPVKKKSTDNLLLHRETTLEELNSHLTGEEESAAALVPPGQERR